MRHGKAEGPRGPSGGEDWTERARGALGDVEGAVEDMLRPAADRELGPAVHRRLLADGLATLRALLDGAPQAA